MIEILLNKRVILGDGAIGNIVPIYRLYNCFKVFILVYSNRISVLDEIKQSFIESNISYYIYDKVDKEPDLTVINEGKDIYLSEKCDSILSIGGGSVIDAGKAIALLVSNGGQIEDYQFGEKHATKLLPLSIAVPTTSGTGSEATKVCVVYNNENGLKKSVYHHFIIPDIAILDPMMTVSLPAGLTASTGMDALCHAIESYISLGANDFTEMFSLKAIDLIYNNINKAVKDGCNKDARLNMALGSYLAGCALNAGICVAHIVAQPIGAIFGISHGDACSIFLPISMEINKEACLSKFGKIAEHLGIDNRNIDNEKLADLAIEKVKEIRTEINGAERLSSYVDSNKLNVDEILYNIKKSTGHIKSNPRLVDDDLLHKVICMAI